MDSTKLKSRYIFIDTQSFVKMGLNFNHAALQAFLELCKDKKLFHLTTTVVRREVESKIQLSIQEALKSLRDFRRKARILEKTDNENLKLLFKDLDEEEIQRKAIAVFERFLSETHSKILTADSVDTEKILELYFGQEAPFSSKKKFEFPDAISLYSLLQEIGENIIYVISEDSDMKTFCETNAFLISIDTLDKFLDLYNEHENAITELIKDYLRTIEKDIKIRIEEGIEESWVYNSAPWEDSEVSGLSVVEVFDLEPTIIWIDEKECLITFDVDVDIEYEVTGPDPGNSFYDKEEKRMYIFDTKIQVGSDTKTFSVEIGFSYNLRDSKLENIEETTFYISGLSDGIEVYLDDSGSRW